MTPAQLLSALAAVRHYARHEPTCAVRKWLRGYGRECEPACTCGLDDTLRGIDAMLDKESDDGS